MVNSIDQNTLCEGFREREKQSDMRTGISLTLQQETTKATQKPIYHRQT